jgi:WD40 repeat protein
VTLWDVSDPAKAHRIGQPLTGGRSSVASLAFTPDGRTLASGSSNGTIILWDVSDPAKAHRIGQPLTGHTETVNSLAVARDGRTLASGSGPSRPTGAPWPLAATIRSSCGT